jgi:hypothetical protein
VVFLSPFAVFTPQLVTLKKRGLMSYGALGSRLVQSFDRKWMIREPGEALLGAGDISSLADFTHSYEVIRSMRVFPIELAGLRAIIIPALLPALPLILTQIPLESALKVLLKVLV